MNAYEITKYLLDTVCPKIRELEEQVDYLTQENEKLRRITDDFKYDIKDLQMTIRRLK